MIDFSRVKGIRIPEGNAAAVAVGGVNVFKPESWDVEWEYSGSLPPTSVWYSDGPLYNESSVGAINFYSPDFDVDNMSRMMLQSDSYDSDQCVFEVEFSVNSAYRYGDGFYIRVGTSYSDSHHPSCVDCVIVEGGVSGKANLYVMQRGSASRPSTPAAEIELGKWYKLRLRLDTVNGQHKVFLDGRLIAEQTNDTVYDIEVAGPMILAWYADAYVRALRYRASL